MSLTIYYYQNMSQIEGIKDILYLKNIRYDDDDDDDDDNNNDDDDYHASQISRMCEINEKSFIFLVIIRACTKFLKFHGNNIKMVRFRVWFSRLAEYGNNDLSRLRNY